jgi:hypothetical protein
MPHILQGAIFQTLPEVGTRRVERPCAFRSMNNCLGSWGPTSRGTKYKRFNDKGGAGLKNGELLRQTRSASGRGNSVVKRCGSRSDYFDSRRASAC